MGTGEKTRQFSSRGDGREIASDIAQVSVAIKRYYMDDRIMVPDEYSGKIEIIANLQEVWCTFPNDLLTKLSHEKKKELFQKLQAVIDEYAKEVKE